MLIKVKASPYACFYLVFELLKMFRKSLISIRLTIAAKITSQIIKTTPSYSVCFSGHKLLTPLPQISSLIYSLLCLVCFTFSLVHLCLICSQGGGTHR